MFDTYTNIFNLRGDQYHRAISECPDARREEFELAVQSAVIGDGQVVIDAPSGGAYLARHIRKDVRLVAIETSAVFAGRSTAETLLCADLRRIPLATGSADRLISLAGSHHLEDKRSFYQEVLRLLRPGGRFCLADVHEDSAVAGFLNGFVHEHNSLGHEGAFLNGKTPRELGAAGFTNVEGGRIAHQWHFADATEMARFCKGLFGLDRADEGTILAGISRHLGYSESPAGCVMNWELYFLTAKRP